MKGSKGLAPWWVRAKHKVVYEAMLSLVEKKAPVDLVSVVSELRQRRMLEEAGGPVELATLTSIVPTAANARYYAALVRDASVARAALAEHAQAQREIFEGPVDAAKVKRRIAEIAAKFDVSGTRSVDERPPVRSTD